MAVWTEDEDDEVVGEKSGALIASVASQLPCPLAVGWWVTLPIGNSHKLRVVSQDAFHPPSSPSPLLLITITL